MAVPWNHLDHPFLRWYYPELALCRTQFERIEAADRARAGTPGITRQLVLPVVLFIGYLLAVPAVYHWARPHWLPMWSMSLVMVPATPVFLVVMFVGVREHSRRVMRRYLVERGVAVCIACGYDLRGLDSAAGRCPECGEAILGATASAVGRGGTGK